MLGSHCADHLRMRGSDVVLLPRVLGQIEELPRVLLALAVETPLFPAHGHQMTARGIIGSDLIGTGTPNDALIDAVGCAILGSQAAAWRR